MSHSDTEDNLNFDTSLETVSGEEMTRRDQLGIVYDESIRAPLLIVWSDWRARVGSLIILLYVLMGTVGIYLVRQPEPNQGPRLLLPFQTLQFPLGTDGVGQDLLALIVHATPAMLIMITAGAIFSIAVATVIGTVAGYSTGTLGSVLMTFTDIVMTIPGLPLVILVVAIFPPRNPVVIGVLLSLNAWAGLARALRSQVLTLRNESYVEASRAMGVSTSTILRKDIVPNLMPYILISFTGAARAVIFGSVSLYFLGILPFSNLNWGVILNQAYSTGGALYTLSAAHWLLIPMFTIIILAMGLVLFAQGCDRLFNPRVRARHAKTIHTDGDDTEESIRTNNQVVNQERV